MRASFERRRVSTVALSTALAILSLTWVPGAGEQRSTLLAEEPVEPVRPELHDTVLVDGFENRMLIVEGALFGERRGKVRVGGRRARVREWSDTAVTVKVPRRVGGGALAVEIETRDRVASLYPLPVLLPGEASGRRPDRVALRIGALKRRCGNGEWEIDQDFQAHFVRERHRWYTTYERRRQCWLVYTWLWPVRRCRMARVPVRNRRTKRWHVWLRVPAEFAAPGPPRLCTAADQPASGPPIEYWTPKFRYSVAPDWWIVIGRDETGELCGQFGATAADVLPSRRITGRFVLDPEPTSTLLTAE